jgi:hypothetical protein
MPRKGIDFPKFDVFGGRRRESPYPPEEGEKEPHQKQKLPAVLWRYRTCHQLISFSLVEIPVKPRLVAGGGAGAILSVIAKI